MALTIYGSGVQRSGDTTDNHLATWDGTNADTLQDGGVAASGSVTSVSVVTANGLSGSVATATTTPAITLTLAPFTPAGGSPAAFAFAERTFNGVNTVTIKAPTGVTTNVDAILPDAGGTIAYIAQSITNGVTVSAPSEDAVFDALALKQAALTGTYNLGDFTDPGDDTPSAAVGGTIGTLIFGLVRYTPGAATESQTLAVETAIASAVYTDVCVVGIVGDDFNVGGVTYGTFSFFVPTGRKWKHTVAGSAAVNTLSGIAL